MPAATAYLIVGVAAALTTALATPVIRRAAAGAGLVIAPDERHVHEYAMPNLGGLAMLAGLVAGLAVAWGVGDFSAVFATPTEMIGLLVAATLVCAVGTLDDVRPVSAPAKVAGMVAAGSVLSLAGVSLLVLRIPFLDLILLSPDLSALFTVVWVVLIANAVNLIDGLDGLAGAPCEVGARAGLGRKDHGVRDGPEPFRDGRHRRPAPAHGPPARQRADRTA